MSSVRPQSASGLLTGFTGVIVGTLMAEGIRDWEAELYLKTIAVLVVTIAAMLIVDFLLYRGFTRRNSGLVPVAKNPFDRTRILQKIVGFYATIAVIAFGYWVFAVYWNDDFVEARQIAFFALPFLVVLGPLYIIYVDARQEEPNDAYVQVAKLIGGVAPDNWGVLSNHARSWIVKAFFLPLMITFLGNDLANMWLQPVLPLDQSFAGYYEQFYGLLYMWDVLLSAIGYILTFRIFGAQIKSAEPTLLGWVVCLLCYPPFYNAFDGNYFAYDADQLSWGNFFAGIPVLFYLWGTLIIVLVGIYVWATISFGIKFSNLTNRGIITHGPYRWVKHPAYLSKNLSWWMVSVPFLTTGDWQLAARSCIALAMLNCVYFARAKTEERHLARDPVYVEYQAYIAEHGLFARLRGMFGLGAGRMVVARNDAAPGAVTTTDHGSA